MVHLPKNHPLRSSYRFLALLTGIYCLVFGAVGAARTADRPLFDQGPTSALGLRTNLAFSILSILVGVLVLAVVAVGRNVDRNALMIGPGFMLVGLVMLAVLRASANILNFSLTTVNVSFVIGLLLFAAAMYIQVASPEEEVAEEAYRHSTVPRGNVVNEDPREPVGSD